MEKEEFKSIRFGLKKTQTQFGAILNITRQHVGVLERGESPIQKGHIAILKIEVNK